jgi:Phytanoyl-CoA dioxygenase (PhyH)
MISDEMHRREFWLARAPALHIEERAIFENLVHLPFSASEQSDIAALLKDEGYVHSSADWGVDLLLLAETVRDLSADGLSPVFAFVYDEFWCPFLKLHHIYNALLGGRYLWLPAFWVWNVDPKRGEAGWKPHRDRGRKALFDDGSPKALTTWIPLSLATPLNGCMYIVPASHDPIYATEDELNWKPHLEYSSIRALPAKPGDYFIWNQAVLHWGGRTSPRAAESRVSMAFECQRADVPAFNEPLIGALSIPSFELRLKLIAKQILQYKKMYTLKPELEAFASNLLAV